MCDYESIKECFDLKNVKPGEVAPLILAHIGDAVYEVIIRTIVLSDGNRAMDKVHRAASSYANAGYQSKLADYLADELTEEELSIYKRGRNAKSGSKAKNATIGDYRKATGFEALVGYLYLCKREERMLELIHKGIENVKK